MLNLNYLVVKKLSIRSCVRQWIRSSSAGSWQNLLFFYPFCFLLYPFCFLSHPFCFSSSMNAMTI